MKAPLLMRRAQSTALAALLFAFGAMAAPAWAATVPAEFAVRDSAVASAAKNVARNQGGMVAMSNQITGCARDLAGRLGRPRADFCLAFDVLVSNIAAGHDRTTGAAPLPGLSTQEASRRFDGYMNAMGVPAALRQAEIDDVTRRTTVAYQEAARLESLPALVFEGPVDGGTGTFQARRISNTEFNIRMSVGGPRCAGDVEGTAVINGPSLNLVRTEDGAGHCGLKATLAGNAVTISENQCADYHGASCAFGGTLTRTK